MTNTLKTPEQIAGWIYDNRASTPLTWAAHVQTLMAEAIEADRAQRDAGRGIYIVQNDVGDVLDVFRDADEATAAHQDETCSVIEEIIWEPGEYAAVVTACGWSEATA